MAVFLLFSGVAWADGAQDFLTGRRLREENRLQEALGYLTRALSDDQFILKEYVLFEIAETYFEKEERAYAAYKYDEFLKNFPQSVLAPRAQRRLGLIQKPTTRPVKMSAQELYRQGKDSFEKDDYAKAEALFLRLAQTYPRHRLVMSSLEYLGRAEYQEGKLMPAIANLEKSLKQAPNARKLYYLGRAYGRRGKYFNAIKYMRTVLAKYPQSGYADDARYYLALYYELTDSPRAATKCYLSLLNDYPNSSYADEAIFRAGMLLYRQKDYESAFSVFSQAQRHRVGEETPKCLFWWGKLAERLGRLSDAAGIYYYLTEKFDHTYASYRARHRLGALGYSAPQTKPVNDREKLATLMEKWESGRRPEALNDDLNRRILKYKALMDLNLLDYALGEARIIVKITGGVSEESAQLSLATALHRVGEFGIPIRFTEGKIKQAVLSGKPEAVSLTVWKLAYPKGYFEKIEEYSRDFGLDPYLALAVIREESRFNPRALSRARAHGLMQVIPSTGRILAKQLDIKPFSNNKMYNVDVNVKMGTKYLSDLIRRFDGNVALALAGYNGGPVRIKKLVNNWYNGDMRNLDIDEFIEYIPMRETRYYVQKVLGSYYEYKRLYE